VISAPAMKTAGRLWGGTKIRHGSAVMVADCGQETFLRRAAKITGPGTNSAAKEFELRICNDWVLASGPNILAPNIFAAPKWISVIKIKFLFGEIR
jgi:hypothetical protein